jgi:hypothetical protein
MDFAPTSMTMRPFSIRLTIVRYLRPWQLDGAAAAHFTALLVDPLRNGEVRGGRQTASGESILATAAPPGSSCRPNPCDGGLPFALTPNGHRGSVFASPVHEFPDFGNNDGTFTNRGSDTLD